jgi:hypothetical protein
MSGKSKVTLTPIHPAWPAFHAALGELLTANAAEGKTTACSHRRSMLYSMQALAAIGLAQRNVLRTREFFREHDLMCDCDVWARPEELLKEIPDPYFDEEGNFDSNAYYLSEIKPYE